ncbi:MAG: cyclophilin-like fold protein [Candidatus Omnitrophota bacterium]
MDKIILKTQKVSVTAQFDDSEVSRKILKALPLLSKVSTWGEEIYFPIPVDISSGEGTLDVNIGDIAYWPEGSCLCVFFGRTPVSTSEKPVPASEVLLVGKVIEGIDGLKKIKSGEKITVSV